MSTPKCSHDTDGDGNCPIHPNGCPTPPSAPAFELPSLLTAAGNLCEKMRLIHDDPLYKAVWDSARVHGISYANGPTYQQELAILETVVQRAEEEANPVKAVGTPEDIETTPCVADSPHVWDKWKVTDRLICTNWGSVTLIQERQCSICGFTQVKKQTV